MPNWCSNTVRVNAADITKFSEWLDNGKGLLSKIAPTPQPLVDTVAGFIGDPEKQKALEAQEKSNVEQFGFKNWYDWNVANWGTKWDLDVNIDDSQTTDTEIVFSFDSAWSPPEAAMKTLSEMFPEITIRHSFMEEGNGFVGVIEIQNGEVISEDSSSDCKSDEWKRLAADEFGWEPWADDESEEDKLTEVSKE